MYLGDILYRARYYRNIKVSTMTVSIPPPVPKLTLRPFETAKTAGPVVYTHFGYHKYTYRKFYDPSELQVHA